MGDGGEGVAELGTYVGDVEHVGESVLLTVLDVEVGACSFFCHHRGKGAKSFPLLDDAVDPLPHCGEAGIGEDAAVAKRSGSEFHAPLEPPAGLAFRQPPGSLGDEVQELSEADARGIHWGF